jgi:hypothetical protein
MAYTQNAYPNQGNFPEVSFPDELIPPDVDPDEGETILVAYSPEWSKVLAATCDQMLQFTSWQGTHDEKILAVNRAIILKILLQTPFIVPERDYPAPYWDDETDVDDELPVDEQDWYGQVEDANAAADEMSFSQNAVIWLLTGFVALVASPTLPGAVAAAITFRTLATRFVLAFNRGDLREQFRVIIDAEDYGNVDTDGMAEGDIVELTVDGLETADFHDILIVVTNPA